MTQVPAVPYTLEQDEDGFWCARARIRPGVGARGRGADPDSAVADLQEALAGLVEGSGPPR
ncbi:hypothetical protein [Nocardiopsis kunsanensis]|uniref:Uncharacterized protein n=1 Tax=Nocardiopsis kunsanensis TaxID=141693 RepID=A0A918X8B6_9ACTN|nr:hypothetical protein [Nocardiopsis kunsanensis]GHD18052.1 hypothetical protein GCM10007147_07620 [Nocardiopsis kunsanensis]